MNTIRYFDGQARLYSTRKGFAGPKSVPLKFTATFAPDGVWKVAPADFGEGGRVVIPDVKVPVLGLMPLVVNLQAPAQGTHDAPTGVTVLDARFAFSIAGATSFLALRLDIHPHAIEKTPATTTGERLNLAVGRLVLAGKAEFQSGHLHRETCLVALEGALTAAPAA